MNLLDLFVKVDVKDEASGKVNSISSSIKGGLASAASAAAKATAAAIALTGAAVVKIGKQALDAYSSYEQLAGGVEKIFDQANVSGIMADAQNAYKELNMSANQYLAAINQTGAAFAQTMGDQKGYDTARQGMLAIADYASGTGRSVDELNEKFSMITRSTSSYQSIADQFSGILPATSADFLEQAKAAGFLKDSYTSLTEVPIDEYQQAVSAMLEKGVADMGLAGNTAAESSKTIEGSINATKAAWVNLLTELGKQDGDIPARMQELMESVTNVVSNVTPVIERVAEGIAQAAPTLIPVLIQSAADVIQTLADNLPTILQALLLSLISVLPQLVETSIQLFMGILQALVEVAPQIVDGLVVLLETLIDKLPEYLPQLIAVSMEFFQAIALALLRKSPEILALLGRSLVDMVGNVSGRAGDMLRAGLDFIGGLLDGVRNKISELPHAIWEGIKAAVYEVTNFSWDMYNAGVSITSGLADGIRAGFSNALSAVAGGLSMIRSYLPFSPAKRGPFSGKGWTLYSGISMMTGLAEGIRKNAGTAVSAMRDAMGGIQSTSDIGIPTEPGTAGAAGAVLGNGIIINIDSMIVRKESDIDAIAESLSDKINRRIGGGLWRTSQSMI